ncbi:MAG: cytochrome c oxidase subunit 3 [Ardenticatenia bacterium]|nr:cytochrome c oxidase subunit 3 [Ardenticatenia bacterium]
MSSEAAVYEGGYTRFQMNRMGLWFFIISEAFMFLALHFYRFMALGTERPEEVNVLLGGVLTVILLASSVTAHRAEQAIARGDTEGLQRGLLATIGLGVLFLVLVAYEWSIAFTEFPPSTPYGSIFYLTTGTHALHLLSGIGVLALVYKAAKRGAFTAESHWGVHGGVLYWHFVDVVWLSVFTVLYLL